MNGTPTTTVHFQDTTGLSSTARFSEEENYRAKASDELDAYAEEVAEGDYVTVVYRTRSNGNSIMRSGGHVSEVERTGSSVDIRFEDDDGDAYLHLNAETGDYYFQDGRRESPETGWRVARVAWTPENEVVA